MDGGGTLEFRAFHAEGMAIADPAMFFNLVSAHLRHSDLSTLHPSCGSGGNIRAEISGNV